MLKLAVLQILPHGSILLDSDLQDIGFKHEKYDIDHRGVLFYAPTEKAFYFVSETTKKVYVDKAKNGFDPQEPTKEQMEAIMDAREIYDSPYCLYDAWMSCIYTHRSHEIEISTTF